MPKPRSPRATRPPVATKPEKEGDLSTTRFCVMLTLETQKVDASLSYENIMEAMQTPEGAALTRQHILKSLPRSVARLVAVFPEEHARMLTQLHEALGEDIAKGLSVEAARENVWKWFGPPPGYVPPHDPGETP